MKEQVLTDTGLYIYDEEIKQYVLSTANEIKKITVQISDDDTFEELDAGGV